MWWALAIGAAGLAYGLVTMSWARHDRVRLGRARAELGACYDRIEILEDMARGMLESLPDDRSFAARLRLLDKDD